MCEIVRVNDFLGVVAAQEEYAIQAANQLKVVWKWPDTATLPSSGNLYASAVPRDRSGAVTQTGSVDAAFAGAAHTVSGTFAWPVQMHGTLGPPAAIVSVTPNWRDRVRVYAGDVRSRATCSRTCSASLSRRFGCTSTRARAATART